jgi:hypothetical protein
MQDDPSRAARAQLKTCQDGATLVLTIDYILGERRFALPDIQRCLHGEPAGMWLCFVCFTAPVGLFVAAGMLH